MLDDKTFLTSVGALETAADRLGQQTVTIQTDHLRRLREMAGRPEVTVEPIDFAELFQDEDDRAEMAKRQPAPVPGEGDVWAEVIADGERRGSIPPRVLDLMRERRQVGIDRYGVPLQRGNGRDGMRDLLEELLDAVAYSALCGRQFGILVDLISMLDADMRAKP